MHTSESTTSLFKAMIEAAPEVQAISKSKQAYGYKYATLDSLIDMLRGALPKHGLWFTQSPSTGDGRISLTTRVLHVSGEWIEDTIEMQSDSALSGKVNEVQKAGAAITYLRRYTLSSIFGVASDEDVDGNVSSQGRPQRVQEQPQRQEQARPMDERERALAYVAKDYKRRAGAGEVKESILKHYADLLKTDTIKSSKEMDTKELVVLVKELERENANV